LALRDLASEVQHHYSVRQIHHQAHVLFDEDDENLHLLVHIEDVPLGKSGSSARVRTIDQSVERRQPADSGTSFFFPSSQKSSFVSPNIVFCKEKRQEYEICLAEPSKHPG
jgi:hypothetical protein